MPRGRRKAARPPDPEEEPLDRPPTEEDLDDQPEANRFAAKPRLVSVGIQIDQVENGYLVVGSRWDGTIIRKVFKKKTEIAAGLLDLIP